MSTDQPTLLLTREQFLRRSLAAGALMALPGVAAGCAGPQTTTTPSPAQSPRYGGRLRVGHVGSGSSETVSPLLGVSFIDAARITNLFDTLTQVQPDATIKLWLAESMEANADARVWHVRLRKGVTFHNGKPLGADDVLYSIRYIVAQSGNGASLIDFVDVASSRKVDDLTVELRLKRPIGDLGRTFSQGLLPIFPDGFTDFSKPIGTGPFMFQSFTPGERSLFTKNPHYWVSGQPYVDELEEISIPDNQARLNALLSGQIDALEFLDLTQAKSFQQKNDPRIQLVIAKGSANSPIYMRINVDPFSDLRVRQALKLSIDRPKTLEIAFLGFGSVGNDVFGKGAPSYNNDLPQRLYDPEQAKSLLKQAGREVLTVELLTAPAGPGLVESATAFAEQAKASGITINLNKVPASEIYDTTKYYLKVPFGQTQWSGQTFEQIAATALTSTAPYNETAWFDPVWDKRFFQAQGTVDERARNQLYFEVQRDIWERGGYILWAFQDIVDAASPKIRGVVPNQYFNLGNYQFKTWWFASK